ncbi:unnamed protein product [Camellia sinensis]
MCYSRRTIYIHTSHQAFPYLSCSAEPPSQAPEAGSSASTMAQYSYTGYSHIHNQILDHEHMGQRRDRRRRPRFDLGEASQAITAVDVHRAGPTDSLAARSPEGEGRVEFVLDLLRGRGPLDHSP